MVKNTTSPMATVARTIKAMPRAKVHRQFRSRSLPLIPKKLNLRVKVFPYGLPPLLLPLLSQTFDQRGEG